jgi:hypothetical protein
MWSAVHNDADSTPPVPRCLATFHEFGLQAVKALKYQSVTADKIVRPTRARVCSPQRLSQLARAEAAGSAVGEYLMSVAISHPRSA